jgi:asparagine synthetase A
VNNSKKAKEANLQSGMNSRVRAIRQERQKWEEVHEEHFPLHVWWGIEYTDGGYEDGNLPIKHVRLYSRTRELLHFTRARLIKDTGLAFRIENVNEREIRMIPKGPWTNYADNKYSGLNNDIQIWFESQTERVQARGGIPYSIREFTYGVKFLG